MDISPKIDFTYEKAETEAQIDNFENELKVSSYNVDLFVTLTFSDFLSNIKSSRKTQNKNMSCQFTNQRQLRPPIA